MATLRTSLKGVLGAKTADALRDGLALHTVGDLLYHFPRRYAERGEHTDIGSLRVGDQVTVMAQVQRVNVRPMRQRRGKLLEVVVGESSAAARGLSDRRRATPDGPRTGRRTLTLTFFNQHWRERELKPGRWGLFAGKVTEFRGKRQLNSPDYRLFADPDLGSAEAAEEIEEFAGALIPVYPAAAGLPTWTLARCVRVALDVLEPPPDPLDGLPAGGRLVDLGTALRDIHRPPSAQALAAARRRLKWDEAFALQVTLVQRKVAAAQFPATPRPPRGDGLLAAFDERVPFVLTEGQATVGQRIAEDLAREHPMHRLLQGEVGSGKAQPLDSNVLTSHGFRAMGSLEVGDEVITPGGEKTVVTGVFPQGVRDVYRVVLSDGTSVECDLEHLWLVNTTGGRDRGTSAKVLSLREIRADLHDANGGSNWCIPTVTASDLECGLPRPVDPYVLGLLLGGGHLEDGRVGFSSADPELVAELTRRLPPGCQLSKPSSTREYDGYVVGRQRGTNPLLDGLRDVGAYGVGARAKAVPERYLIAPVEDRLELLQGLLDTDGTVDGSQGCDVTFVSASAPLAEAVVWLAESLGGTGRCREATTAGDAYHAVSVRLPSGLPPFRLRRKASLLRSRTQYQFPVRAIRAVEYVGRKPVQCISVASPEQLYVTDHFVVTHNTMVALRAMLQVVDAGGQAAMLAPTEVLATQHHRNLRELLGPLGDAGQLGAAERSTAVALLTGSQPAAVRRAALTQVASGEAGIVVGTHALLYEGVEFADLGLVVVDEQHRFGVEQRDALRAKADQPPHVLVMTATPIPRTVAMTVYGDLETSSLSELPAGRSPITTHLVPAAEKPHFLDRAWRRVTEEVAKGHQAYVVCPRIGEASADEDAAVAEPDGRRPPLAVLDVAPMLEAGPLADLSVGVLHGQLPAEEKDAVMREFAAGRLDVLVATTVVEVGVDVPNATMMVVMDADRFGVSQLHQLRGRVGRGNAPGLCLLVTESEPGTPARERLDAVASTVDGFRLAELDLEQRREGDVLGAVQSGRRSAVKLLSLLRDADLILAARTEAIDVVAADPELTGHPALADAVAALVTEERAEFLEKG